MRHPFQRIMPLVAASLLVAGWLILPPTVAAGFVPQAGVVEGDRLPQNSTNADLDEDGVEDEVDNCPQTPNPGQEDTDKDTIGDACDRILDPTPTATSTPVPTSTRTPAPTQTPSATPSATVSPTPVSTSTPEPSPTPEPAPTSAPSATFVPTAVPAQLATATPKVSPTAATPTPSTSTPTATPTRPAPTATPAPPPQTSHRPDLFDEVLDARDVSTSTGAIAANLLLSLLLLLLLVDASIFNSTVKENEDDIMGFFGPLVAPLRNIQRAWTGEDGEALAGRVAKPLLVLGASALVYSLLEPGFRLDTSALVLFLSLLIGLGVATYVYEGTQVLVSERLFNIGAAIRFYPVAILIAVASVAVSKLTGLHPGLVFGFVAGATFTAGREPDRAEDAKIVFLPMVAMLGVATLAWLLLAPLRDTSDGENLVALVLEGAALSIFLGGLQGLLFSLIPIAFLDGQKVWQWSKRAWLSIVFPVCFLFFHVVINQDGTLRSAAGERGIAALIVLAACSWSLTGSVWLYFRWRRASGQ